MRTTKRGRVQLIAVAGADSIVGGSTRVVSVEASATSTSDEVQAAVCADASQITLIDADGQSKVSRTDRQCNPSRYVCSQVTELRSLRTSAEGKDQRFANDCRRRCRHALRHDT